MNDTKQKLIMAVMIALILGIVGSMDVDDEQGEHDKYCQMVNDGLWPEYRAGQVDCE
jgi:hypothetical protein